MALAALALPLEAAPELVRAFAFGARQLTCATASKPDTNYTIVFQGTPAQLQYAAARGWGYEVLRPGDTTLGGYGIFGPFDDSANTRAIFPDTCPSQLYDSFIGFKTFAAPCAGIVEDPDSIDTLCEPVEGGIFRVDVPNGRYRFVAAVGSADNPHVSRIIAEDGGTGGVDNLGPDHVVLVHNFDQGRHGTGVFARVGFGCTYRPPAGEGMRFVDMDDEGLLSTSPNSPTLEVTQGYIRIHQLKGATVGGDPNGGDMVILELWRLDDTPIPAGIFVNVTRSFDPAPRLPGDEVAVTLDAAGVSVPTTIVETIPNGWTVVNAAGGGVNGNAITFNVAADGPITYRVRSPDTCLPGVFSALVSPQGGCQTTAASTLNCFPRNCGLQATGAVSKMLFVGPIQLTGDAGALCDDNGLLASTDYLSGDQGDETSILVGEGDEVAPDFGGLAGGLGVAFAPNAGINPNAVSGVLTVWSADADPDGRINMNDGDNIGDPLDDYVIYGIAYLNNTTAACLDAIVEVGSDDAVKVRLNGRLVHARSICRAIPAAGAGDRIAVSLAPGVNILLVAVVEQGGGTDFRVILRNPDGTPLNDGRVTGTCDPPADYPAAPLPAGVSRAFESPAFNTAGEFEVTLAVSQLSAPTTIVETFPSFFSVSDAAGGTVNGSTITFVASQDGDIVYTLKAPDICPDVITPFSGVTSAQGGCSGTVAGPGTVSCVLDCPVPPNAPPAEIIQAFHFGSRALDCPIPSFPEANYVTVLQVAGDPSSVAYSDILGYGYEVFYNPAASPGADPNLPNAVNTTRGGWEIYGPMDDSPNGRTKFPDTCPEQIYDSFIGCKDWRAGQESCTQFINDPPDPNVPCAEGNFAPIEPDGVIFRVDVPNGKYRFVAAVGDADNPHAHRIVAEDGGEGPPSEIGPRHVVLVSNFDQSQYNIGQVDLRLGEGVYARVGFDGKLPPAGDGVSPDPQFINMDDEGKPTSGCPSSPTLEVTQGYIRIHCLQANSNVGPGGGGGKDPNGGDMVLLELWRVESVPCERRDADTHCRGLLVRGPADNAPGIYSVTADAVDDAGDRITYSFKADNGAGTVITAGPQTSRTAGFDLGAGNWTLTVEVDDDCPAKAADSTCTQALRVGGPEGVAFVRGDTNADGGVNIADASFLLNFLFLGGRDPSCADTTDANDDGTGNIADASFILNFLFLGGRDIPPPNACGQAPLAEAANCAAYAPCPQ